MPLTVLIPPANLPVTLAQIKQHLRIDHAEDDTYLLELAEAAAAHCEAIINRFFIERTVRQYQDCLEPGNVVKLKAGPVRTVEKVTGFNNQGAPVEISATQYVLKPGTDPAELHFSNDFNTAEWPNGIEIDFTAGHGPSGLEVPSNAIRALLVLIGHWYEHRGTHSSLDQTALIPDGFERLLAPLRRARL